MRVKVKKKWVDALRSGEYTQGQNRLVTYAGTDEAQYCCLGVLCDLAEKAGVVKFDTGGYVSVDNPLDRDRFGLPKAVSAWAGLTEKTFNNRKSLASAPQVTIQTNTDSLANHNDNGKTFEQIAEAIERDL